MSRGKRYDDQPHLNKKKVVAVLLIFVIIVVLIYLLASGTLTKNDTEESITSKDYFASFKDNKWGVIDQKGNDVITPSYAEMIVVPDSKTDVFLCTYDVNYDTGEYKTLALNSKSEQLFTQYDQVEPIQNIDDAQNAWYEKSVLKVQKDGKYGIINLQGKELTEIKYDEIEPLQGIQGVLKVKENEAYGIINDSGTTLVDSKYIDVTNLGKDTVSGFIVEAEDGKYGVVDSSNNVVLEPKYDEIEKVSGNDLYVVRHDGTTKLVKNDGTEVLTSGYDSITDILKAEGAGIIFMKDSKSGVMDLSGNVLIEPNYDSLKETKSGIFIASKDGKYGVIDLEGNTKIDFNYAMISYNEKGDLYVAEDADFNNEIFDNTFTSRQKGILISMDDDKGYMKLRQNDDYKYYNYNFEEKQATEVNPNATLFLSKNNGKYGFVDKEGNLVVDYIYDDATEQNSFGFAGIKKDGKWGSIDSSGNVVQEPIYNLDDYLQIDFIGRWHYGKDLNMNYYNQLDA